MSDAIQPFKLDDAAQQLREKIRSAFVALIPPEQWEAMVKKELEAFATPKRNPDQYAVRHSNAPEFLPSIFQEIAAAEYKKHVQALVKEELAKPEWGSAGNDCRDGRSVPRLSEQIKVWLTENRDALLEATLRSMFGGVAQEMLNSIRNMKPY